jgi:hypothetical protein
MAGRLDVPEGSMGRRKKREKGEHTVPRDG